jgi:hypothetical protein
MARNRPHAFANQAVVHPNPFFSSNSTIIPVGIRLLVLAVKRRGYRQWAEDRPKTLGEAYRPNVRIIVCRSLL